MDSRSLVKQALEFKNPVRVPRHLWMLPWTKENFEKEVIALKSRFPDDICRAPACLKHAPKVTGDAYAEGIYVDEWGCVFENRHRGIIGEVKTPAVASWKDLDKINVPKDLLSVDIDQVNAFCKSTELFVLAGCAPRLFERLQFIRGTENIFMDIAEGAEELSVLIDMVHQFNIQQLELWASTDVDAVTMSDDWGSQKSLLISPEVWRKIFKPLYKEYIDIAHRHGKYIFMHSDGFISDILPDLVELGLDAINCQIFCMDIEDIGNKFRSKITFWGEIDRQHLLPNGTIEDIGKAVRRVWKSLYDDGGVIAQCEFGPGAKPENVIAVFHEWNILKP